MSGRGHRLRLAGELLELLPERAAWWPAEGCLLLADLHLGKDQVFRDHGIPIPAGPLAADLERLSRLLARLPVRRVVIIGDLVHAPPRPGDGWVQQVAGWRREHAGTAMDVVLGNHDRGLAPVLQGWDMRPCGALEIGPFRCVHDPAEATGPACGISGHLHPVLKLRDGRERLRVPVFWQRPGGLVLPAFGIFTGGQAVQAGAGDRLYAVASRAVYPVGPATAPTIGTGARR